MNYDDILARLLEATEDSIQNKASQLEHALNLYKITPSNEALFQAVKNEWLEWKKKRKTVEEEIDYLRNIRKKINTFCKEKEITEPGTDFEMCIIGLPLDLEPSAFDRPLSAQDRHAGKDHQNNDSIRSKSAPPFK